MEEMLLKAARLWDGLQPEIINKAFLLVKDGKIAAIGRQEELGSDNPIPAHNLGDCTLMPGLINMHAHLNFNASDKVLADYFREKEAGLTTLTLRAVDNMQRALKSGVTTLRDCGTLNEVVFGIRAAVESGLLVGPRVIASGNGITITGGHCYYFGIEADTADEVRKAVRSQAKAGADFIKIFATGGNLTPGSNPIESQYTETELKAATTEAKKLGKLVASHAHGPEGIRNSVAARVNTLEHCTFMVPGGVDYDVEVVREIAEAGIFVVPTLSVSLARKIAADPNYGKGNPIITRYINMRVKRSENFYRMRETGVRLVSGSDSGIPGVFFEDFAADVGVLVNEVGLSPFQALLTATSEAAVACGLNDTGVLAVGKRADLLAVAGNPLENIAGLEATRFVAVAGKVALQKE